MGDDDSISWARDTAARWLDVPEFRQRRWRHVQAVGRKAEQLAPAFGEEGALLSMAAWLHDIGYAPGLQLTAFHPIDGARELEDQAASPRLVGLVANHSGASSEAALRGLNGEMLAYPDELTPIRDALWTCDMTTSPVGEPVDFEERLTEIVVRYGADHIVSRAISRSSSEIRLAITRTRERAEAAGLAIAF